MRRRSVEPGRRRRRRRPGCRSSPTTRAGVDGARAGRPRTTRRSCDIWSPPSSSAVAPERELDETGSRRRGRAVAIATAASPYLVGARTTTCGRRAARRSGVTGLTTRTDASCRGGTAEVAGRLQQGRRRARPRRPAALAGPARVPGAEHDRRGRASRRPRATCSAGGRACTSRAATAPTTSAQAARTEHGHPAVARVRARAEPVGERERPGRVGGPVQQRATCGSRCASAAGSRSGSASSRSSASAPRPSHTGRYAGRERDEHVLEADRRVAVGDRRHDVGRR